MQYSTEYSKGREGQRKNIPAMSSKAEQDLLAQIQSNLGFSLLQAQDVLSQLSAEFREERELKEYLEGLLGVASASHISRYIAYRFPSKRISAKSNTSNSKNSKKKTKFERLVVSAQELKRLEADGVAEKRDGRIVCECQAFHHELLGSCMECGRVVCRLEGNELPCVYCAGVDSIAISTSATLDQPSKKQSSQQQQQHQPAKKSAAPSTLPATYGMKIGAQAPSSVGQQFPDMKEINKVAASFSSTASLSNTLSTTTTTTNSKALDNANKRKETLLDFDRNSVARTKVHDSAADFDLANDISNKWLSLEERALALKKMQEKAGLEEELKSKIHINLDLQNKTVTSLSDDSAMRMLLQETDMLENAPVQPRNFRPMNYGEEKKKQQQKKKGEKQ